MTAFPRLGELQRLCWRLITAPEGVEVGAAELREAGSIDSEDLAFLIATDERMTPEAHLDVYADMYFYRLRDCLAEDYPKLQAWIGAEHFHNLVTDYLLAHPSEHFSLRELGRALPGFLAGHALAAAFAGLADLAELEWARVDVFDERDAEPLSRETLLERGASEASFRFGLGPATRLVQASKAALSRWRDPADGSEGADAPASTPIDILVWRRDFGVFHRSLEADEAACLRALAADALPLGEVGEALVTALPAEAPPEQTGERLAALLETWTRDALLVASD